MKKTSAMKKPARADIEDPGIVLFQGEKAGLKPGAVALHAFGTELAGKLFGRRLEDVKRDFQKVSTQITDIVEGAFSKLPQGLAVDTIEVSLAFSAEGKLAFVAEAGVEATLTVTFKKA